MAGVRQFDEEKTLDLALEVFWKKGWAATSMQDLAQATGVQRGSLYNAYQSKEWLFLRVFDRYKARMLNDIGIALDKPSIDVALRSYFDFVIGSMTFGSPTRGCLTTKTALNEHIDLDSVREALQGILDQMELALRERLAAEDARPQLTLSPADAARLIITLTRGIVVMERVYQDPERLKHTAGLMIQVLLTQ